MSVTFGYLFPIGQSKQSINIKDFICIGRAPSCDFIAETQSFKHCRIALEDGQFMIRDLNSDTGTYVNGTKINYAYLNHNDRIYIGSSCYVFVNSLNNDEHKQIEQSHNKYWQQKLNQLPGLARTDLAVLIHGESGSGKEIIARQLHSHSNRKHSAFISVNCSALTESLIESELFGHKKGSFTGAESDRKGAFLAANGGSLFLDEIGDLPLSLQPKLLRAIENSEIKAVGSDSTKKIDVRIITATHKNLEKSVVEGTFREDLFYRINTLQVKVPSLKERPEDFESLLYYFCKQYKVRFTISSIQILKKQRWKGNIRELKNTIARASALYKYQEVNDEHLGELLSNNYSQALGCTEVRLLDNDIPPIKKIEKDLIIENLKKYNGNQKRTAETLKIPPSTLHDRIKSYKINVNEFRL